MAWQVQHIAFQRSMHYRAVFSHKWPATKPAAGVSWWDKMRSLWACLKVWLCPTLGDANLPPLSTPRMSDFDHCCYGTRWYCCHKVGWSGYICGFCSGKPDSTNSGFWWRGWTIHCSDGQLFRSSRGSCRRFVSRTRNSSSHLATTILSGPRPHWICIFICEILPDMPWHTTPSNQRQAINDPSPVIKAAFESVAKQHCQRWITNSGIIQWLKATESDARDCDRIRCTRLWVIDKV